MHTRSLVGKIGEERAASFLEGKGYKVILKNYKNSLGEIDIIAQDKDTLCFIEVKARRSERFGSPKEGVSLFKQHKLSQVAVLFLKENDLLHKKARFDVVSVLDRPGGRHIELIRNAFELSRGFIY
ncbi:MAG: YraN family protein [Candidatus Omnitrophota bacterium]